MKIKSIYIENFKTLNKINISNFGDLNIFIGKNNAGKSAILDSINFENINFDPTQIHFDQEEARIVISYETGKIEDFLPNFKKEILDKIEGSYSKVIYSDSIVHKLMHNKEILMLEFFIDTHVGKIYRKAIKETSRASEGNLTFIEKKFPIKEPVYSSKGDQIEVPKDELPYSEYRSIIDANIPKNNREDLIAQVGIINGTLGQIKKEQISRIRIGDNRIIPKDKNLINEIKDYINRPQNRSKKEKMMKYLKSIESPLYDIFTPLDDEIQFTYEQHPEFGINLNRFGSGMVQLIEIMYRVLKIPDGIILIEEPETNLHPDGQKILFEFLKEESKNKQIFLTTHSPIFINKSKFENVYLVRKENYETIVEEIKENEGYKILEDIGIKPSDILQSDFLVFVEGPSDKNILKQFMEIYDKSINKMNFIILPLGGQNIDHVNFDEIAKINREFIVILDSHRKSEESDIDNKRLEIKAKCESLGKKCFILKKAQIENYLSKRAIEEYYGIKNLEFSNFDKLNDIISNINSSKNLNIKYNKIRDGHKIVKSMKKEEIDEEIISILEEIKKMGQ